SGHVSFARTFDWSSTGVATGNTPESVEFTLPAGDGPGAYLLSVIANGIASDPVLYVQMGRTNNPGSAGEPGNSSVYNLPMGKGGDSLHRGSGQRDIPVAGVSPSTPGGDSGEDLFISGSTVYDAGSDAWLQNAAYWACNDNYVTRLAESRSRNR